MPDTYHHVIESRIADAILELDKFENPNVAAVARQFNVPAKRLINRWKGCKSKIECGGHNKALSEAQESALCQYPDNLDGKGPKAHYKQLEQAANALLKKGHTGGGKPPKNWSTLGRLVSTKTLTICYSETKATSHGEEECT